MKKRGIQFPLSLLPPPSQVRRGGLREGKGESEMRVIRGKEKR